MPTVSKALKKILARRLANKIAVARAKNLAKVSSNYRNISKDIKLTGAAEGASEKVIKRRIAKAWKHTITPNLKAKAPTVKAVRKKKLKIKAKPTLKPIIKKKKLK